MTMALAVILACSAAAANLVPEAKRDFEVPFKGAGQMSMVYTPVFFPKGTEGVVVSGEAKWSDVVRGDKPWFDARVLLKFKDSDGKDVKPEPRPTYVQKPTNGWQERENSFLVPQSAVSLS